MKPENNTEWELAAWELLAATRQECDALRADVKRLIVERNRITELVAEWRDMPSEEMRMRAGDMTAQEIRSVKSVLNAILSRNC
jgi:hypothetical protein